MINPANTSEFSVIIETATAECHRCHGFSYSAEVPQILQLLVPTSLFSDAGSVRAPTLAVWSTNETHAFIAEHPLAPSVSDGVATYALLVQPQTLYTVTSTSGQQKGVGEDAIPASASFPAVYSDDFDTTPSESLGKYFADQGGSFQVRAKRLCARVRAYVCCASVHTLPEVAGDCSSQLVHPLCTCSDVLTYAHLCIPPHPTNHTHLLPLVRSHSC